ncbi:hypothetical protein ScPMuIL_004686 [Solemya velum]
MVYVSLLEIPTSTFDLTSMGKPKRLFFRPDSFQFKNTKDANRCEMTTAGKACREWRSGKSFSECSKYMFEHQIAFDVTFLVGEYRQEIQAHKFVLISRSLVFETMLCGPLAETYEAIPVPDIEPDAFKTMLRYMYCDEVDLEEMNVSETLYAAKKYCVDDLSKLCTDHFAKIIDAENACALLDDAQKFNESLLSEMCFAYILENGERCLQTASFCDLSRSSVRVILEADNLFANETTVWRALLKWSKMECLKEGIPDNGENVRHTMGNLLFLVRFCGLTPEVFAKHFADNDILTGTEVSRIFRLYHHAIDTIDDFSTKTGRYAYLRCIRLSLCHPSDTEHDEKQWEFGKFDGESDAISFQVSAPSILCGIMMYGCRISKSNYAIAISLSNSFKTIFETDEIIETCPDEKTFDVFFSKETTLVEGELYRLTVSVKGERSYWGIEGRSSVTTGDVIIEFKDVICSNGTTVSTGQIPGLILRQDIE